MVELKEYEKWHFETDFSQNAVFHYKTKEEAYVKTRRLLRKKFPNSHDLAIKLKNKNGWEIFLETPLCQKLFICGHTMKQ